MDRNSIKTSQRYSLALGIAALLTLMLAATLLLSACDSQGSIDGRVATTNDDPANVTTPLLRDPGFFGINTAFFEPFFRTSSWREDTGDLTEFTLEARVSITSVSGESAQAGLCFLGDCRTTGYSLTIGPGDRWRLRDAGNAKFLARSDDSVIASDLGSWHSLKAEVTKDQIRIFYDGVDQTPSAGIAHPSEKGQSKLIAMFASASFDDVKLTDTASGRVVFQDDFSSGDGGWQKQNPELWTIEQDGDNSFYQGDAAPEKELLLSPELSPDMNTHFDQMKQAGASSVRVFFEWSDIQPFGPDEFIWNYADTIVTAARQRGLEVDPCLSRAPRWAISPAARGELSSDSYPPENLDDYARFVAAVVQRYKPGGDLAREEGWDDGYGVTHYELGQEFNVGRIYKSDGRLFFAGWMGTLGQYVDLLKVGHDQLKANCASCTVLSSAAGDDVPTAYETQRKDPVLPRQTLWQGVEDLYEEINRRHPGDPDAIDKYFDVLSIHTYQWFMLTAQGQTPDIYRAYAFPDPLWYRDRLTAVMDVLERYGDSERDIWLTETSYTSADTGDPYAGSLTEAGQADALRIAFTEAAAFPQVKKVFWWYAYDVNLDIGLIRKDLSTKPSYDEYARLAGAGQG